MKKLCFFIILVSFFIATIVYADTKLIEMTEDENPTADDMLYMLNDPEGTPVDRKVAVGNLPKGMNVVDMADWPVGLTPEELGYVGDVTSAIQTQLDGKIDESVITGQGIVAGSAASTPAFIETTENNCLVGRDNNGALGCFKYFTPVWASAPASDDTYSGTIASFVAGETLVQWNTVYCKNKSGVHACYKYDANGADKALPPRYMVTPAAGIAADASGVFLLTGIVRNDGWAMTSNQDEGKIVYADTTTAGGITLTRPSTTGDMVAILGYVIEQNVIYFNPSPILVEVP